MTDFALDAHVDTNLLRNPNGSPEQLVLEEAWQIAIDLRRDLGLPDAIAWADAYLDEVRERESSPAVARWAVVISALAEMARATIN